MQNEIGYGLNSYFEKIVNCRLTHAATENGCKETIQWRSRGRIQNNIALYNSTQRLYSLSTIRLVVGSGCHSPPPQCEVVSLLRLSKR